MRDVVRGDEQSEALAAVRALEESLWAAVEEGLDLQIQNKRQVRHIQRLKKAVNLSSALGAYDPPVRAALIKSMQSPLVPTSRDLVGIVKTAVLEANNVIDVHKKVLAYARERQAYARNNASSTVDSYRIAGDLLQMLGEEWDE